MSAESINSVHNGLTTLVLHDEGVMDTRVDICSQIIQDSLDKDSHLLLGGVLTYKTTKDAHVKLDERRLKAVSTDTILQQLG